MSWEPDYCTDEELSHYVRTRDTDLVADDAVEVGLAIAGASRAIDLHCHRQFGVDDAPTARQYRSRTCSPRVRTVKIDDLMDNDGLTVVANDGTARPLTYALAPVNNPVKGRPWTMLRIMDHLPTTDFEDVLVTGTFGWTAVPDAIKQACLLQASRFLARRESPFGVAGSPDTGGSELRLLARVDPDVGVTLARYVRWWA